MDTLLTMEGVSSAHNTKGLCHLYDLVKSHVRYLKLLSVTSNSYGTLLTLVLLSRLPDELKLLISWNIGGNNWTLDALMTHVEKEIKAREQATAAMTGHGNQN